MKKRLTAVLLSATMLFSLLAACDGGKTNESDTKKSDPPVESKEDDTTKKPEESESEEETTEPEEAESDESAEDSAESESSSDSDESADDSDESSEPSDSEKDNEGDDQEFETIGDVVMEDPPEAPTGPVTYEMVNSYDDVKEYSFLMCWNGGAGQFPTGFEDGAVAKAIEEKTGVRLIAETIVSSEREKLSTVFMSGDVPDITNAPHWSTNPGGEGELILQAGVDGLLLDLKPYVETYPNIWQAMNKGVSETYKARDIFNPKYEGAIYVMPTQTGRTGADIHNWAYNIWVREDILKDLGYAQADINTEDKLYELLTKIKEGSYTDINGLPVIPSGTWHEGWSYSDLLSGFSDRSVTGWHVDEEGKVVNDIFLPYWEERIKFMRKLTSEGLFDKEAFTQTDTVAQEKAATGRVAVLNAHYPHVNGFFKANLYPTNPEMKYVPVGPMQNDKGETPKNYTRPGRSGSPVVFLSAEIEEPERALNYLDFLNSDEGILLGMYGIEGTHYTWVDGIPTVTDEWKEIKATDSNKWHLEGMGIGPNMIGSIPTKSWGWDADYEEEGYVEARKNVPNVYFEGDTMDDVAYEWEGREDFENAMSTVDWGKEQERAYLAASDEEALQILEDYRARLKESGLEDMTAFLQEKYDENKDIIW